MTEELRARLTQVIERIDSGALVEVLDVPSESGLVAAIIVFKGPNRPAYAEWRDNGIILSWRGLPCPPPNWQEEIRKAVEQ